MDTNIICSTWGVCMNNIDFKGIAEAALNAAASLLSEWLPDGVLDGHEFVALNPNRADKKRGSFRININTGRWADFAIDKTGSDLISLYSYVFSCNQGEAAKAISKRLSLGGFETHNVPKMKTNKKNKNDNWETVMPVPEFAVKSMDFKFYTNKQAAMTSVFKDANGAVLCGSARFINSDGSKEDLPYTFCRNKQTGMQMWRWRGVDGLRPIYGLDAVANNPNALVLVVEGEKCKQKSDLQGLPYAVITWHGGGKAVNKVDWSAITNRRVVLWADADLQANKANDGLIPMTEQVGVKAMQWLAERLQSQGCDVRGINVYGLMPQNAGGWDIADALDDVDFGGRERIIKLVDAAPSWHANLAAMEIDFKNHFFNATPPAPTINSSIENVTNPAQDNLPAQEQEGKGGIETPEQKLVTLKLKFCLVEGKNSAVNKTTGVQYSRTALIAHFGKEAVDAWYEWGKARVLTMFEINKIKKKYEREHEDELLKEDKEYIDMMERYIYLDGSSSIWDNKLWRMIDQGAAKLAMGDSFKIWVNSPNRRVIPLDNIVFSPDEEVSAEKINLYRGLPMMDKLVFPMPKEDMPQNTFEVLSLFPQCQNIQRLVTHLCSGNWADIEFVYNWLAYPLQHAGTKLKTALVFHGDIHGSGKSLFFEEIIKPMYGEYGITLGQSDLESKYTANRSGKLFVLFEEIFNSKQKYDNTGMMKHLITGKTMPIERKFIDAYEEENHINCVFSSNELQPFKIDENDRRYFVQCPQSKLNEIADLKERVLNEIGNGGIEAFFSALMALPLTISYQRNSDINHPDKVIFLENPIRFDPNMEAPMTEAKASIINLGRSSWQAFLHELAMGEISNNGWTIPHNCAARPNDMLRLYRWWCQERRENETKQRNFFEYIKSKRPKRKSWVRIKKHNGTIDKKQVWLLICRDSLIEDGEAGMDALGQQMELFATSVNGVVQTQSPL